MHVSVFKYTVRRFTESLHRVTNRCARVVVEWRQYGITIFSWNYAYKIVDYYVDMGGVCGPRPYAREVPYPTCVITDGGGDGR